MIIALILASIFSFWIYAFWRVSAVANYRLRLMDEVHDRIMWELERCPLDVRSIDRVDRWMHDLWRWYSAVEFGSMCFSFRRLDSFYPDRESRLAYPMSALEAEVQS